MLIEVFGAVILLLNILGDVVGTVDGLGLSADHEYEIRKL